MQKKPPDDEPNDELSNLHFRSPQSQDLSLLTEEEIRMIRQELQYNRRLALGNRNIAQKSERNWIGNIVRGFNNRVDDDIQAVLRNILDDDAKRSNSR